MGGLRYMTEFSSSCSPAPYVAMLSRKIMLPPKNMLVLPAVSALSAVLSKNAQSMNVAFGTEESITPGLNVYNVVLGATLKQTQC